ncbi:MAG: ATPase [Deltaproteobacteria bacterium]|nr:ATPase [Deltaproteobacteria bacterium]
MPSNRPLTMLVLACYFKGERFMKRAKERGAKVYLLTQQKLLDRPWPREALDDVFAQANGSPLPATLNTVSYLMRNIRFDRIVGLDDYDVEVAASLREHLRIPGMGETQARFFRDKLACRIKLRELGIPVPDFTPVFNNEVVAEWIARVPAPWMLKPRSEASATGIHKVHSAEELWPLLEAKGDGRAFYHLEQFLPGDIYHADSITSGGKVVFAEVARCGDPPFNVAHGGGIFTTVTLPRGSEEERTLKAFNEKILTLLGYQYGASHVEFIKGRDDGKFYLLETSARVGGAHIAEMHEASTGVNLWQEWADLEVDLGLRPYKVPERKSNYGGLLMTLAKQERPDYSSYSDKEVVFHAPEANHAGLVVTSPDRNRVESLVNDYKQRFVKDFMNVLPNSNKPSH